MVNIYVCGPTVYDDLHIGNARPIILTDLYIRALIAQKTKYFYVQNITDVDDKIIKRALELGVTEQKLTKQNITIFRQLLEQLNVIKPDRMPKVTDYIGGITDFVAQIVAQGAAYEAAGNVFFDTQAFVPYGQTFGINLRALQPDENSDYKRHPHDFALWKATQVGVRWPSPWGQGRPGWHTECAFFVNHFFQGATLSLHCGGIDLKFPHHENENAQFKVVNKRDITRTWKHFGHLTLKNQKMSKSLNNIWKLKDFLNDHSANFLRYIFFSTNPFAPLDLDETFLKNKHSEFAKIESLVRVIVKRMNLEEKVNKYSFNIDLIKEVETFDFAEANLQLQTLMSQYNINKDFETGLEVVNTLVKLGFEFSLEKWDQDLLHLFKKWEELKDDKKYAQADKIREILKKSNLI